jgi:16S rRNA (guanine527-N7)-methyltransferase
MSHGRPIGAPWRAIDDAGSGSQTVHAPPPRRQVERPREPLPLRVQDVPELPPEASAALDDGLALLGLADLPAGAREAIDGHLRLLLAWTGAINLTAIRDPIEAVRRHVLDSLTALPLLRERGVEAFIDLGSGGGYPGIPLAAAGPARRVLLVDSVAKKVRFLETVVAAVGLEATVEAFSGRAEALAADFRHRERWPGVLVRAVGDLTELAELSLPLLAPDGLLIAWKRAPVQAELDAAAAPIAFLGGSPPIVIAVDPRLGSDDHVLVLTTKIGPSPVGYPRDPAERRRRPL